MTDLSVVIATYNRADRLKACLDALAAQSLGSDAFEVVVVIDGSTDSTREFLAAYHPRFPLKVIFQENAGQPKALNRGVREASGRFCLLMDDDIVARPEMASEHLRAQRESGGILAAGRLSLRLRTGASWYARRFADGWARHYERLDSGKTAITAAACYGGNLSFPREPFLAVGGFAEDLSRGYDVELAHRLIAAGLTPRYLPGAQAVQDERKTSRQLLRDEERAGAAVVALYDRDPSSLPSTGLSDFHRMGRASLALRRALLGLGVPAAFLEAFGRAFDRLSRGRWYRFVRSYAFWRGVKRAATPELWEALTGTVTILLYHAVTVPGEGASRFVVAAREFAWQMRWLARSGRRVLTLEEYVRARRENRTCPARSVIITFDDGYVDNGAIAGPILARYGLPATLFLVTDRVADANRWDAEGALADRPILSWDQIRALGATGFQFAPHGRTHRSLEGLSDEELADEIGGAWSLLRREVEHPVPVLAFPFGRHDLAARTMVESLGLLGACTAKPGRNTLRTPLDALRRAEIGGETSRMGFRFAVRFGASRPIRNRRRL